MMIPMLGSRRKLGPSPSTEATPPTPPFTTWTAVPRDVPLVGANGCDTDQAIHRSLAFR